MLAVVGHEAPFDHGREQMHLLAGLSVTTKAVERTAETIGEDIAARQEENMQRAMQLELPVAMGQGIPILYVQMDGTGVPMVRTETQGRAGKRDGEPAHTREAKLGCVFTQTTEDQEGRPLRDEGSTTYVGAIETAEEFGLRLYAEAWQRGWARAEKKVVIGDGADWIWNIVQLHFPDATQIVDLYHARQHLWELAAKLYPNDSPHQRRWMMTKQDKLDNGKIESLVASLRSLGSSHPGLAKQIRTEADYFQANAERMRYPKFHRQKLFVGSGVIEAGCKTIIGTRLKQSGMFWTVRGANAIIALRCCRLSGKFEDYWESRRGRSLFTSTSARLPPTTGAGLNGVIRCNEIPTSALTADSFSSGSVGKPLSSIAPTERTSTSVWFPGLILRRVLLVVCLAVRCFAPLFMSTTGSGSRITSSQS
jgi:hypothetical protein